MIRKGNQNYYAKMNIKLLKQSMWDGWKNIRPLNPEEEIKTNEEDSKYELLRKLEDYYLNGGK